jgi:hypothetical protein
VVLDTPIDIDIGFAKKADLAKFASHDAAQERLLWVKEHIGVDAYQNILANILVAKKILKEGKAYKKFEDGGLGGIGVENWILSNNGNIAEACKSFYEAAYKNDAIVSLEEFKKNYHVFDPGINIKFNKRDDYIRLLKEPGYKAMVEVVRKYIER